MSTDPQARGSFSRTPVAIVLMSLALFAAGVMISGVATLIARAIEGNPDVPDTGKTLLTYLVYVVPLGLCLLSIFGLIVGAIRWAMFGASSNSVATTGDQRMAQLLNLVAERLLISETAKAINHRKTDLGALRQAIREDIARNEFDTAMILVQQMADRYGYREESEQYREQIERARQADREQKIDTAVRDLDAIINRRDWEAAAAAASKLQRIYPESQRVRALPARVATARQNHKEYLEREFLAAAARDDVDRAVEMLKELDRHLTPDEAEPFRETARGVIGKKRDNLGVQFKLAVHDKEWITAVRVGEQIIREFPNTKMAEEVRGRLDLLRERAAGQQAARERELA